MDPNIIIVPEGLPLQICRGSFFSPNLCHKCMQFDTTHRAAIRSHSDPNTAQSRRPKTASPDHHGDANLSPHSWRTALGPVPLHRAWVKAAAISNIFVAESKFPRTPEQRVLLKNTRCTIATYNHSLHLRISGVAYSTRAHLHISTSHILIFVHIQTCTSSHLSLSLSFSCICLSFLARGRYRRVTTKKQPSIARNECQVSKTAISSGP